ncbi:MAG: hypothetical protein B9S38_07465 [Verrucomicrobiia bacterium Tous-C4TDCM]|jgi:hypothetical protein|nr:MAG: hypothetical protein B9S38_07465 [Verrucomicrobiae bacterium Tous-C4TDCM]
MHRVLFEVATTGLLAAPVHIPTDVWRKYWPVLLGAIGVMIVLVLIRGNGKGSSTVKAEPTKGWRVGHEGRDSMYYEEKHGGSWRRIRIDGEMLTGRAHHAIYFGSIRFPDWAEGRREEIIGRIKSAFPKPDYEYDER